MFPCAICGITVFSLNVLHRHCVKVHRLNFPPAMFPCELCEFTVFSLNAFHRHCVKVHRRNFLPAHEPDFTPSDPECDEISSEFSSSESEIEDLLHESYLRARSELNSSETHAWHFGPTLPKFDEIVWSELCSSESETEEELSQESDSSPPTPEFDEILGSESSYSESESSEDEVNDRNRFRSG